MRTNRPALSLLGLAVLILLVIVAQSWLDQRAAGGQQEIVRTFLELAALLAAAAALLLFAFPFRSSMPVHDTSKGNFVDAQSAQIQSERDELRRLFDAFMRESPVTMYLKRASGEMEFISGNLVQQFGATNEQIRGKLEKDLIPLFTNWSEEAVAMLHHLDSQILETKKPVAVEGVHPGTGRFELVRRFPIFDSQGEITHIGGIQLDIDDLMKAREEVAKVQDALHQTEKLAALGQLLAGVSHELNNPLTVVVGRSAILQEKLKGTPHLEAITSLREAADRCNRIVKTFLAMARQSAPQRGIVNLNDVVESAYGLTSYGLRTSGISVHFNLDDNLPDVDADEDQFVQVTTNLIINAHHALDHHGGDRRLVITTRLSLPDHVELEVADNGPGVPSNIATRVFEPFFTTKAVNEGTGMGLPLARGIVEEHEGTLTLHETHGGGATFRVRLPVGKMSKEQASSKDNEIVVKAQSPAHILIVDDEKSIRDMLAESLLAAGFATSQCESGLTALEEIKKQHFDVILCDVRMSGLDGIGLYQRLEATLPDQAQRMIFLTGDVLKKGSSKLAAIKKSPVLEKPFDIAEVLLLVRRRIDELGGVGSKNHD